MGSHSVTCHPTEVNAPRLNPSQIGRYSIYLLRRDGRLSWPRQLVTSREGLPAHRQSPIAVLTGPGVQYLRWSDRTRYHYTTPKPWLIEDHWKLALQDAFISGTIAYSLYYYLHVSK